uniref:Secreted protein n=1 Tax=Mus musculus TaxID=10090 RepID=Q3U097_MOUSE|nr:unnamed protein product [Mus musculus]
MGSAFLASFLALGVTHLHCTGKHLKQQTQLGDGPAGSARFLTLSHTKRKVSVCRVPLGAALVIISVDRANDAWSVAEGRGSDFCACGSQVRSRHSMHAATHYPPPSSLSSQMISTMGTWIFLTNKIHRGPAKVRELFKRQVGAL